MREVCTKAAVALLLLLAAALAMSGCAEQAASPDNGGAVAAAERREQLAGLDKLAEQLFHEAESGGIQEARALLEQFAGLLSELPYGQYTTIEGQYALIQTVAEGRRLFNSVTLTADEAVAAAAKLRLAADALAHRNQPMWLERYPALNKEGAALKSAVERRSKPDAERALQRLQSHFLMIRPAALLSADEAAVEQADSLLAFFNRRLQADVPNYGELDEAAKHVAPTVDRLFGRMNSETVVPPVPGTSPVKPTLALAGIVILVLGYVGWRRYKAGQRVAFIGRKR